MLSLDISTGDWKSGVLSEKRPEDSKLTDQETYSTVKTEILDISVQQDMVLTMDAQYSFFILEYFLLHVSYL